MLKHANPNKIKTATNILSDLRSLVYFPIKFSIEKFKIIKNRLFISKTYGDEEIKKIAILRSLKCRIMKFEIQ